MLLAVEFVEVLRGKFAENCTVTKAFLLVSLSVLLRGNKTVWHQDISAPVDKDSSAPRHFGTKKVRYQDKSAPHFLSNKRDYLLQNKINES